MVYVKVKNIAHHALYLLNPGITKFEHSFAVGTNQVIVLFIRIRLFKLREILTKLMFGN